MFSPTKLSQEIICIYFYTVLESWLTFTGKVTVVYKFVSDNPAYATN